MTKYLELSKDQAEILYVKLKDATFCSNAGKEIVDKLEKLLKEPDNAKILVDALVDRNGRQIEVGDKLCYKDGTQVRTVSEIVLSVYSGKDELLKSGKYYIHVEDCIEPDSWEKLSEDSQYSGFTVYWGCVGTGCSSCPAKIDGKRPNNYYNVADCGAAARKDIIMRAKKLAGVEND